MPIAAIFIAVVAVIGVGAYFVTNDDVSTETTTDTELIARTDSDTPTDSNQEPVTTSGNDDDVDDTESAISDLNSYSASASYLTPARTQHDIDVTLAVDSAGIITSADVTYDGNDTGFSNPNQERFDNAFEAAVIGQNLSDLDLAVTGGASLTTGAFNDALAEIKTSAGV